MLSDFGLIGTIHDDDEVPDDPDSESDGETVSIVLRWATSMASGSTSPLVNRTLLKIP